MGDGPTSDASKIFLEQEIVQMKGEKDTFAVGNRVQLGVPKQRQRSNKTHVPIMWALLTPIVQRKLR